MMKQAEEKVRLRKVLFYSLDGLPSLAAKGDLERANVRLHEVHAPRTFEEELRTLSFDAVVHRCHSAGEAQKRIVRTVKEVSPGVPVIVSLKSGTIDDVVNLMKAGASDIIISPEVDSKLAATLSRALKEETPSAEGQTVEEPALVGASLAISEVKSAIALVANSHTPVLISGESGTGKEVAARLIHGKSGRSHAPFVALNCAAIPHDVIENELFGHERGSFTGAGEKSTGCFDNANRGTLFFDEIGEMLPDLQAKLLRVIEQKAFRRLGGKEEIHVDVRTIAATNKNIEEALKSGEFRQDLYYRFSVIEIHMPPLRDRSEDIPLLIEHFHMLFKDRYKKQMQQIGQEAVDAMSAYDWPGNVRELKNVIERIVVTNSEHVIRPEELPPVVLKKSTRTTSVSIPIGTTHREAEKMLILRTLDFVKNNKSRAARMLGISRKTLHNKLIEFLGQSKASIMP
ncbi:MAG TPA: sigma-54 dependent transcriptional regulator [Bacteroidota bacterium]|nr:sigma-54 dependent transcriptional regulator [Bacteroidota bacterium]